jgi:starvation-inducible DNA-binding protein
MKVNYLLFILAASISVSTSVLAQENGNKPLPQGRLVEDSYPLTQQNREAAIAELQPELTELIDLALQTKQAHWNVSGALYLPLHEQFDHQVEKYYEFSDRVAERILSLGYSADGRPQTIVRSSPLGVYPQGYVGDEQAIKLEIDRLTKITKNTSQRIERLSKIDPVGENLLQDIGYTLERHLWQMRIHLQKPGSTGESLPYTSGAK